MTEVRLRRPGGRANPTDPMSRALPTNGGTLRYFAIPVATDAVGRLTVGTLRSRPTWRVHRVGRVAYAHCASGARWIIGFATGSDLPNWWPRLLERAAGLAPGEPADDSRQP